MIALNNTLQVKSKKIRVGRGIGSGKGKTSGRGVKGQKSRSGVSIKSFEGGQMPLYRRLPKRGFKQPRKVRIAKINLDKIQYFLEKKIINPETKINLDLLKKAKIIKKNFNQFKILGKGEVKSKLSIEANYVSKPAKEKIEKLGGKITLKNK